MATLATPMALQLGPISAATTTSHSYPASAAFGARGPIATTTTVITDGTATYDVFRPADYDRLAFKSPIVTWGNGTNATPAMYSTLLSHFASYGFTVIATTLANTGSGREIDAAARYLVKATPPRAAFSPAISTSTRWRRLGTPRARPEPSGWPPWIPG